MRCGKAVLSEESCGEELESRLRSMPEFSCVDYMGVIPNTEVAQVLRSSRIGANTILDVGQYHHLDTFGVKVFEYMSVGLPVLLPDYPYMRTMAEKYGFGVCVKTDDVDSIANAITYLLGNPGLANNMGQNGRKAVKEQFNWSTQEQKLLELYSELMKD